MFATTLPASRADQTNFATSWIRAWGLKCCRAQAGGPCGCAAIVWVCVSGAPAVLVVKAGKKPQQRVLAPATTDRVQSLITDAANDVLPVAPDVLNASFPCRKEGSRKLSLLRRVGKINATEVGWLPATGRL